MTTPTDPVREALAELIALDDLKRSLAEANHHAARFPTDENYELIDRLSTEIGKRQPLALPAARAALSNQPEAAVTEEMVNRFLGWKLPKTFSPDCGISFDGRPADAMGYARQWPIGTNLFTATEARAMLDHVLGSPPQAAQQQSGWLIESKFKGAQPTWWNGVPEGSGVSFTPDPDKAVRFPRQEDAEAVARHMHMVSVTEHVWM